MQGCTYGLLILFHRSIYLSYASTTQSLSQYVLKQESMHTQRCSSSLKITLVIWGLLYFRINVNISWSISGGKKKPCNCKANLYFIFLFLVDIRLRIYSLLADRYITQAAVLLNNVSRVDFHHSIITTKT